jgi:hypothetical protein
MFLMPDDKVPFNVEQFLRDSKKLSHETDESFRRDAYQHTPLMLQQGNCIRCHDKGPGTNRDFNLSLSFAPLKGFDDVPRKPVDAAEAERRLVDKFSRQPAVDKAITVLNRLPSFDIKVTKDNVTVAADFVKALEAIPGVKLDKEMKEHLSKLKQVGFENGIYSMKLDKAIAFGEGLGTLGPDISFAVKNDTTKPDGVGLTNVKGLKVLGMAIDDLSVKTDGGKHVVTVQGDVFGRKMKHDIDLGKHGVNGELLKTAIGKLAEYQPMIQNRDFGTFTNDVPEGFRNTVSEMLKGVTEISKKDDTFTLRRNNGVSKFEFGGPAVSVMPEVSFKLGSDSDTPTIRELRGVTFSVPLPEKLDMGSKYTATIKGVSLGESERDGGRTVRVDTDNMIDSVKVRMDGAFKPRTDNDGNWNLNVRGNNPLSPDGRKDKMDINLRLGRDGNVNMKPSEVLDIVSRLTWQASDVSVTGGSMAYAATVSKIASWVSSLFE